MNHIIFQQGCRNNFFNDLLDERLPKMFILGIFLLTIAEYEASEQLLRFKNVRNVNVRNVS